MPDAAFAMSNRQRPVSMTAIKEQRRAQILITEAIRAQILITEAIRAQILITDAIRAQILSTEAIRTQIMSTDAIRRPATPPFKQATAHRDLFIHESQLSVFDVLITKNDEH